MSRGGYRPGAGRPKKGESAPVDEAQAMTEKSDVTPLEYMLAVVNDPLADQARRDKMAIAAAPFMHPKAGEPAGKKAERDAQARVAQNGTEWEDLLAGPNSAH
jgi:hypothetical protein